MFQTLLACSSSMRYGREDINNEEQRITAISHFLIDTFYALSLVIMMILGKKKVVSQFEVGGM